MIDGKLISNEIIEKIRLCIKKLNIIPKLAIIQINDDFASNIYVNNKIKKAIDIGFEAKLFKFEKNIPKNIAIKKIQEINKLDYDGIIIQSPVEKQLSFSEIISYIDPQKDVDILHPLNIGKFFSLNKNEYKEEVASFSILDDILNNDMKFKIEKEKMLLPCTPFGCIYLIKLIKEDLSGMIATVIGDSNIVGKPMARILSFEGCTTLHLNSKTKNLNDFLKLSNIIVSATGVKNLINQENLNKDGIYIDVGISRDENGKIHGDLSKECVKMFPNVTAVPGGVGPMTIASLLFNTFIRSLKQFRKD